MTSGYRAFQGNARAWCYVCGAEHPYSAPHAGSVEEWLAVSAVCGWCGERFKPDIPGRVYCGRVCLGLSQRGRKKA